MAINGLIAKMFGTVTYTDGSSGTFGATLDDNSNIATSSTDKSHAIEVDTDKATEVNAALDVLGATLNFAPSGSGSGKVVSDFTMNISGRISRTAGTSADFAVVYTLNSGSYDASGNSGSAAIWTEVIAEKSTILTSWLESVIGPTITL